MTKDSAPGKASAISGWTAFSNPAFVKSALVDMDATTATTTAAQSSTDSPTADVAEATTPIPQNHDDLSDASPSDSDPAQEEKDKLLIADPPRLAGEALMDLARRFSPADIVELSNAATGGNLTRVAINGRLNAMLTKKAKALGTTKLQLKKELAEFRKARGVRSTRRESDHRHEVVGKDTEVGGNKTVGGRRAQITKNAQVGKNTEIVGDQAYGDSHTQRQKSNQADKNNLAKPSPQTDVATNIHQPKGGKITKESSISDAGNAAIDNDPSLLAQQQADHEAFQDQNSLKGEKLLLLAERYSNAEITARICGILGNYPLTENGVATRIHVALEKKAEATGATSKQLREDLNAARLASGAVKPTPRGRGIMRVPKTPKASNVLKSSTDSPATKAPVVAKHDAAKRSIEDQGEMEPPKKRAKKTYGNRTSVAPPIAKQVDAEMTDDGSAAGCQDGHEAGEVEAANTLLEMAAGGPEVREAATILMDMHKGSAQSGGQPGHSGETTEDMNGSEMNDVHKDDCANW